MKAFVSGAFAVAVSLLFAGVQTAQAQFLRQPWQLRPVVSPSSNLHLFSDANRAPYYRGLQGFQNYYYGLPGYGVNDSGNSSIHGHVYSWPDFSPLPPSAPKPAATMRAR